MKGSHHLLLWFCGNGKTVKRQDDTTAIAVLPSCHFAIHIISQVLDGEHPNERHKKQTDITQTYAAFYHASARPYCHDCKLHIRSIYVDYGGIYIMAISLR